MDYLSVSGTKKLSRKSRLIFTLVIFLAFMTIAFFFLPKKTCCDDEDSELEALTTRASLGQLDAINALYQRAKKEGVHPLEEYWALEGALRGDKKLREAYVEFFKIKMDIDMQKRLLNSISERRDMPGTVCLIEALNENSLSRADCE